MIAKKRLYDLAMTEERERNIYHHVCFASIASGISFIISIVVMIRYCYREDLKLDYLSAVVAVISLAVAIFVGVQIYQSFNLKREIDLQNRTILKDLQEKNNKSFLEIENRLNSLIDNFVVSSNYSIYASMKFLETQSIYSHDMFHKGALKGFIYSLELALKGNNKDLANKIVNEILTIKEYCENKINISENEKIEYSKLLSKVGTNDAIAAIFFIQSLEGDKKNDNETNRV